MTTYSAEVIAHSKAAETGKEVFSILATYPRIIHGELMTHKFLSRNAASSRAIPSKKLRESIMADPVLPSYYGKQQAGMQAKEELPPHLQIKAQQLINEHMQRCLDLNEQLSQLALDEDNKWIGLHKQSANRYLEPFMHMTTLITSVHWKQLDLLRNHPDAQPEFQELAKVIKEAREASTPRILQHGEWHLPFITEEERVSLPLQNQIKVSVARSARTSYEVHGIPGKLSDPVKDIELYHQLIGSKPVHASPSEHQCTPDCIIEYYDDGEPIWEKPEMHGNLHGFIQYRKTIPGEFIPG